MKTVKLILFIFNSISLLAQEKTFEREYTYKASELDSKISCRAIAVNQLRSILLNEIGVYVESESLLKTSDVSGKFSQDFVENIATISAGITKLQVLDESWNGETFWMKAAITIDKKSLEESLKQLVNDRQRVKEMEDLKQQLNVANKELTNLKAGLKVETKEGELNLKSQTSKKYDNKINTLIANDFFLKGNSKNELKDYKEAIADFSNAIAINSNYSEAYKNRGNSKYAMQDYFAAILDYTKAIEINPNYGDAYYDRGLSKYNLQDYKAAIGDFTKAIEINPNDAEALTDRGNSKYALQDYFSSIIDYTKAIEINTNYDRAYVCRGLAKIQLGQKDNACLDFKKAQKLGSIQSSNLVQKFCD